MRNPWRMQDGPDNTINRNNFPMSFQYNGTFKYGKIYPIGLIRTIPGASYQIDSTLALNFMPTAFPIQTRQRAYVHFFYGRDRNFWKDYKDFVNGMNPDLVKPYIDESVTKARTGNLLDYLGVPTTLVGNYGFVPSEKFYPIVRDSFKLIDPSKNSALATIADVYEGCSSCLSGIVNYDMIDSAIGTSFESSLSDYSGEMSFVDSSHSPSQISRFEVDLSDSVGDKIRIQLDTNGALSYFTSADNSIIVNTINQFLTDYFLPETNTYPIKRPWTSDTYKYSNFISNCFCFVCDKSGLIKYVSKFPTLASQGEIEFSIPDMQTYGDSIIYITLPVFAKAYYSNGNSSSHYRLRYGSPDGHVFSSSLTYSIGSAKVVDIDDTTSPYWRSGGTTDLRTRIKLNAIPCRMYETIYNLYYRNPQNNPYMLNGKPEYNVFIPTKDGGPDSNLYELRYRNWEDDFLTTAVQTPQQGIAPLVGLTDRGATVTLTNDDGSVTRYKTNLDENGNVTGIETTDSSEPLLTQALIDAVSYGISIEDLRNVNAMQKWLELNLRKGYQYKDIIEARWGISISYNELDLPEFIGGFTQEVGLQAVTQTTSHGEGIEGALGWQAGRMYAGGSGRSITHYCEEEGYIMALLTVVPVPNYSQLLPKHWFTRDLLDSYQPEFNHIGFQPITYKEVCPIQAYQESTENVDVLEQTFGYQRPWYEYFNQVDEVHGQFRTTFKDFLINRTFDVKPELSESFLLVDPNQINDVFAVTTDDDKILGAIQHRITAKLPISLYAQARLE